MDNLERREQANAALDEQASSTALQVEATVSKMEQKLSELAMPTAVVSDAAPVAEAAAAASGAGEEGQVAALEASEEESVVSAMDAAYAGDAPAAELDALPEGASAAATMRYQAARLMVLQEEVEKLRTLLAAKSKDLVRAEGTAREEQQARGKQERAEKQLRAALDREKAAAAEQSARVKSLEHELASSRKEADEARRSTQAASGEQRAKDVRLNRALEELERYRAQLRDLREDREGVGQGARAEAQRLAAENSKLRKRQSDLLLAFRKQAKLIDVLKRQKLHAEAACLLGFTEEEFTRTLELGEQAA